MSDAFKERERPSQEPHVRTIERQILDTLLRIEEILDRAHPDVTKEATAKPKRGKGILG